jgi:2-phosphoglycolate phosphatase
VNSRSFPRRGLPDGCVLFDLDGTLLDTAPDFCAVLHTMTQEMDQAPVPESGVRQTVSNGARALVEMAFGIRPGEARFEPLLQRLLTLYAQQIEASRSALYPGMDELLRYLEAQRIPWGVVTNKALKFSAPLLEAMALHARCSVLICPDHVSRSKPDPEPLLLACQRLGRQPAAGVYVGDHERDISAGRAAGMYTVAAAYGYLAADDPAQRWGADLIIDEAQALTRWLQTLQPA